MFFGKNKKRIAELERELEYVKNENKRIRDDIAVMRGYGRILRNSPVITKEQYDRITHIFKLDQICSAEIVASSITVDKIVADVIDKPEFMK